VRRLCVLAAAILGGWMVLVAVPPPAANAATCNLPAWNIIGVRGSGETASDDNGSGLGTRVGPAYRAAAAELRALGVASTQIHVDALNYPAVPVSSYHIVNLLTGAYATSVSTGVSNLANLIQPEVANCPSTKFILIGYSQGAQVVHEYLDAAPSSVVNRVQGLLLIADPFAWIGGTYGHILNPTTGADEGEPQTGGALAHDPFVFELAARTITICFQSDGICANPYDLLSASADAYLAAHASSHTTYGTCCTQVPVAGYWGKQIARQADGLSLTSSASNGSVVDHGNTSRMLVLGSDNLDHEKYLASGATSWHAFTAGVAPAGTTIASQPDVVVDHNGVIRVFVRGANSKLYVRTHTSAGWDDWVSLGGIINGQPHAVIDSKNTVRVYVRTSNNTVDEISLASGSSTWSPYFDMGLVVSTDAVPIVDDQDIVRVYAFDTNSDLRERSLPLNGTWSAWASLDYIQEHGNPDPVVDAGGTVRVYFRDLANHIYEKSLRVGASWSVYFDLSNQPDGFILYAGGDPVALVDSNDTIRVYAGNNDGTLREKYLYPGETWSVWANLGSGSGVKTPIGAEESQLGAIYVFTRNTSNTMSIDTLTEGGTWSGPVAQSGLTLK
jgi:hypothetical protein